MKIKQKAFTLVEMMIVLVILGLLVGLGVPGFVRARDKARSDTCINQLKMIEHASDQYRIDKNLSLGTNTNIIWLWPTNSTEKQVTSYINRQLICPSQGAYIGGNDAAPPSMTANSLTITANGVPHCVTPSNSTTVTGGTGTDFAHEIT